jgi:uncharacterized membrane protein YfcA
MIALVYISILLAGVIKGITSFGFNLIAASSLLFLLSPKVIVPIITILSVISSCYLLVGLFRYVQIKRILPLLIGSILGIPLGVYGLVMLRPELIKVLMGTIITVFALLFASGFRIAIRNERSSFLWLGLLSGVINGSTSLGGVPIILFFINQDNDKVSFRANLTLFYTIQGIFSLFGFIKGNLLTDEVVKYALYLLIPMTVGIFSGMKLVHRVNEKMFRQIALALLIITGITAIYTGLRATL